MGHIKLASPCSHIWFLRGVPSRMGMVLDIPMAQLERVIYFASYIITNVNEEARANALEELEKEYKQKTKTQKAKATTKKEEKDKLDSLRVSRDKAKEELLGLKPLRTLSEIEYYDLSLKYGEIFEAGTGTETLKKIFEKIDLKKEIDKMKKTTEASNPLDRKKNLRRLRLFQNMLRAGVRPEWMFLTILPVLPPDLRPMVQLDGGRFASSDLNDLYRRVINRNSRLKYLLEINAPDVIVRNEKRMLQEAVDALIDNGMRKGTMTQATTGGRRLLKSLADMLKGKQGRFRQNLLGKRVDYSGRSVIVVGPELRLYQCGLPKKMALELFKPFVIRKILERELAYNVRGASRLIEEETDEVWAILEEEVKNKLVLLNRAPTLHRLGIQAFQPVLMEGESIRVHPMVCKAFNADFDGDQMAVHLPLSAEAQKEAREIMLSSLNLLKPATGTPISSLNQDISLGCYWLTQIREDAAIDASKIKSFGSPEEAVLTYEFGGVGLKEKIKVRGVKGKDKNEFTETSVGRIIFNKILPEDFPFHNNMVKSKDLEKITSKIIIKYGLQVTEQTLDGIKRLGFEYATKSGISWGINDLVIPPEKKTIMENTEKEVEKIEEHYRKGLLTKEEKTTKVIENWTKAKSEIERIVPKSLPPYGSVFQIVDSGSRGSWSQPVQMTGMKGLVINPAGQIIELPIKSSFKEGFDVLEYFISTHGARKGTADTALRTSTAGYLTRRLVDVAHEVIITEDDCRTIKGLELSRKEADDMGQNFTFKIVGRVALDDVKDKNRKTIVKAGEIIDWEKAEEIVNAEVETVNVRSVLECNAIRGVCQKCYGWDMGTNDMAKLGEAVGTVAAQAIGEPGTQLTMRTFHTGGVAGGADITFGLPRVQEIFEARTPSGMAEISQVDGKVTEITPDGIVKIKPEGPDSKKDKNETVEYRIPPKAGLLVEVGKQVKKGDPICEGSLDLKELFKITGVSETQKYIVSQIQKIYVSQGAQMHDKHIEVIVKQMFSRVKIKDMGDSQFTPGEVIDRTKFLETNVALRKAGKETAKGSPVLLGISRVALTTDSFLSAASFQETSRVLIKAALEGDEDKLRGLKENVIIGKIIPAGTGFKKEPKES